MLQAMMRKFSRSPEQTTVAIQGFGNAGSAIALQLFQAGYKIVAVSDSQDGIYALQGLNIPSIQQVKAVNHNVQPVYCKDSVCNIVEHDSITNAELLSLDVDILIPAALENQITAANAIQIQARYIFECGSDLRRQRGLPIPRHPRQRGRGDG